jgi:hypothetical protein
VLLILRSLAGIQAGGNGPCTATGKGSVPLPGKHPASAMRVRPAGFSDRATPASHTDHLGRRPVEVPGYLLLCQALLLAQAAELTAQESAVRNRWPNELKRIQLRVLVHAGTVGEDGADMTGQVIIQGSAC